MSTQDRSAAAPVRATSRDREEPAAVGTPHVLRLCSVFEAHPSALDAVGFDPVGGMQNHTANLTRCLDRLGWRQTVVTSRLGGDAGTSGLGSMGVVVRVGARTRLMRQLWAAASLPRVLTRTRNVDLVHAHQGEDVALLPLAWLTARAHRCPLVVTVHCSMQHTVRGSSPRDLLLLHLGGLVERIVLRSAAAIVTLAEHTATRLVESGIAPAKVHVVPSGFDPDLFAAPTADRFPFMGRPRVGYVGRVARQKSAHLAVQAFGRLQTPAHLVVVGDGPDIVRVQRAIDALPPDTSVALCGFCPHDDVPAVLRSLDVLVLPSTYEELGSVLTEALAVGLPAVASDVGGVPEVLRDSGLLVPPGDVRALAAALDAVLRDPELAAQLSAIGQVRARRYEWPRLARKVARVYRDVLAT
jgi:glycosyltransferase involved in cell wall biosynthesis